MHIIPVCIEGDIFESEFFDPADYICKFRMFQRFSSCDYYVIACLADTGENCHYCVLRKDFLREPIIWFIEAIAAIGAAKITPVSKIVNSEQRVPAGRIIRKFVMKVLECGVHHTLLIKGGIKEGRCRKNAFRIMQMLGENLFFDTFATFIR